jgi:hypothetical protein
VAPPADIPGRVPFDMVHRRDVSRPFSGFIRRLFILLMLLILARQLGPAEAGPNRGDRFRAATISEASGERDLVLSRVGRPCGDGRGGHVVGPAQRHLTGRPAAALSGRVHRPARPRQRTADCASVASCRLRVSGSRKRC